MLWARFVFLLLLSLELGGCWERSTRLGPPSTASSRQSGFSSLTGDDLPTPRFFYFEHAEEGSD
jgi:hypothetical protein